MGGDHVGVERRRFAERPPVGVEDHRVAGAHLAVVEADPVGEDEEHAVVVSPGRKPAHQPAAPLRAGELGGEAFRFDVAPVPQLRVDQAHRVRAARVAASGLVRRDEDLGAEQRGDAHVLDEVGVPADQHPGPGAVGQIEHRERVAADDVLALEGMELAVDGEAAVGERDEVAVVQRTARRPLDQPDTDGHAGGGRPAEHELGGRAVGDRFGQRLDRRGSRRRTCQ